jgi:outer membrane lipoprotein carrier protein
MSTFLRGPMNRLFRSTAARIACCLIAGSQVARGDAAVLESWLKRQASIETLEAAFTQERRLPSLKQPVTTSGKLSFSKPGRVRWQLGEPPATLALSDGTTLTLIDYSTKTARTLPAGSPQAARFSMLTGKGFQTAADFHAMFEVSAHGIDSGIHQYTLRPKDRRLRSQVPWVFLNIDPAKNELRAMELELQDKSRIRTIFHQPVFNTKLPPTLFQADLTGITVK